MSPERLTPVGPVSRGPGDALALRLHERLGTLRAEFEAGQRRLAEVEAEQANLRSTLLRISGAIQVLEEELGAGAAGPAAPPEVDDAGPAR